MRSHCYQDFDAFAGSVRDIDCSMMLLNAKRRIWSIDHVDLGGIHVQLGRLGSGNIVQGRSREDSYVIYVPLSDDCEYAANGTVVTTTACAILEPGCEFCVSTQAEHDWLSVAVPADTFAPGDDPEESWSGAEKKTCRVTPENRQLATRLRESVRHVMTAAATCPQFESEEAARSAAAALRQVASSVIGQPLAAETHRGGRPRIPRQDIIHRSMALLESCRDKPVLVGEMAAATNVSERTLRTAFNEYFGIGPVRYLQLRQLHQVERALRSGDPETESVTDVFVRCGCVAIWSFRVALPPSLWRTTVGDTANEKAGDDLDIAVAS